MKNKGIIICGFAGVGKSYVAYNGISGIVDLESTPFHVEEEQGGIDYNVYIKVATHMANNGYIVLLSCHKKLREILLKRNINYICVLPNKELKEKYRNRYIKRNNSEVFINNIMNKWDDFTTPLENEKHIILNSNEYISDIMMDVLNEIEDINNN